jgi:[acyl-carrier-protein] S-malonyltransferase
MALAVVFPGQGSQQVGMGKALADAFAESRAVFDEVDAALGEKLSAIIFDGPEDQLTLTANAQPALMAVSIAALRALEARGFDLAARAKFVAGHSLGEYSALCAAGTLSLSDTARLLRIRGNAMQKAVPAGEGAMAAIIGLEYDPISEICSAVSKSGGAVQIANDNGGGQIVISGAKAGVEAAMVKLQEAGAKRAIVLPVSAPFHSALMQPAAEAMAEALAKVEMKAPSVPVVANVLAGPVGEPAKIRQLLVEQVTGQVRWRQSVEWMAGQGITTQLELGSGKVLSGLVKRIAKEITAHACGAPQDVEAVLAAQA